MSYRENVFHPFTITLAMGILLPIWCATIYIQQILRLRDIILDKNDICNKGSVQVAIF